MIRRLLFIAGACVAPTLGQAQSQHLLNQAKVWYKGSEVYNAKGLNKLNGHIQLQFDAGTKAKLLNNFQSKDASFYVVFKSQDRDSIDLINYHFKCYDTALSTRIKDSSVKDEATLQRKIETGAIFKHNFTVPVNEQRPDDNFFIINDDVTDKTDLYEVLYFDKAFTEADHQQMQTYLSLKYGITLLNINNYVATNGTKLWHSEANPKTNQHIIGLGRNDNFSLLQKESVNSLDNFLTLSTPYDIEDAAFVLVGDNDGALTFSPNGTEFILNREWLVQSHTGSTPITQLRFDVSQIADFDSSQAYSLVINRNSTFFNRNTENEKIKGVLENGYLVFNDVAWHTGNEAYDSFTLSYSTKNTDTKPEIVTNDWGVYPNPVKANEAFTVRFDLKKESNVNVYIYQSNGKRIQSKSLESITNYGFDTSLSDRGTYIVLAVINGKTQIKKIIVK